MRCKSTMDSHNFSYNNNSKVIILSLLPMVNHHSKDLLMGLGSKQQQWDSQEKCRKNRFKKVIKLIWNMLWLIQKFYTVSD